MADVLRAQFPKSGILLLKPNVNLKVLKAQEPFA